MIYSIPYGILYSVYFMLVLELLLSTYHYSVKREVSISRLILGRHPILN